MNNWTVGEGLAPPEKTKTLIKKREHQGAPLPRKAQLFIIHYSFFIFHLPRKRRVGRLATKRTVEDACPYGDKDLRSF